MKLPTPRGQLSHSLVTALTSSAPVPDPDLAAEGCRLADDDLQLTLWTLYELHYRGFEDVDGFWEWNPDLLRLRQQIETIFERDLRRLGVVACLPRTPLAAAVSELIAAEQGPSLARFIHREATATQFVEFLIQRSIYHLKESDPHSWALPRATGPVKVALAEILYDEFGAGDPLRLHSGLFARSMAAVGLHTEYGHYIDQVPGYSLAVNNAMSFFGLHRRLLGAVLGHLAAFEATSSIPNRRYSQGAARLGFGTEVTDYFEEHVEADAVHEQIALRDICENLVDEEPELRSDVLLGVAVCLRLDQLAATRMIEEWSTGATSLHQPATPWVA